MPILGRKPVPEEEPEATKSQSSTGKFTMRWIKDLTHKSFSLPIKDTTTTTEGKEKKSGWSSIIGRIGSKTIKSHKEIQSGNFSYKQIKAATKGFAHKIGEGGFGSVYKGVLPDGRAIAVKTLSAKSLQGEKEFASEIKALSTLRHPNIVTLFGHCVREDNMLLLVYEYQPNGNLYKALFGRKRPNWETRLKICIGIAKGLAFLHEEADFRVVHRDIKPTNVLLDEHLNPKISDFGLARQWNGEQIIHTQAKDLKKKQNLISILDQELTSVPENEAIVVLDLAILCSSLFSEERPNMSDVVRILQGKNVLDTPPVLLESDGFASVPTSSLICTPILNPKPSSTSLTLEDITYVGDERELGYVEPHFEEGTYHIECSNEEFQVGCHKWKNSLVGYFFSENGTFDVDKEVVDEVLVSQQATGNVSVFSLGNGHFLFQFSCAEDKIRVLESSGLLHIEGKPLVLMTWNWKLKFDKAVSMKSIPVWVKIYNLPLFLWNPSCLSKVGSALGIPICADQKTTKQQRLDYARVYIQVDASEQLLDTILITARGVKYLLNLEYDWKLPRCTSCFTFGHIESNCKLRTAGKQN
ncbi:hypothetical protein MKW92_010001 [Papaver armeniacum]|nr:hypothetical protein MKW92_010001 [Papaver armeniacum]